MPPAHPHRRNQAFTLVEVMMASLILVVGFIGMIEAMTVTSNMMDNARRQTLAAQILNHHIEKLRLLPWDVTVAAPNELCIHDLPTSSTSIAIDPLFNVQLNPAWSSSTSYVVDSVVTQGGAWYRCIVPHTNRSPPNASYWTAQSPPSGLLNNSFVALGAQYTLTRTVADIGVGGSFREVTFTVTWVVTTSRVKSDGTPLTFTYTRISTAYYGKYGLNLSYQRS